MLVAQDAFSCLLIRGFSIEKRRMEEEKMRNRDRKSITDNRRVEEDMRI